MASDFEELFDMAFDSLADVLGVDPRATYTVLTTGVSSLVTIIFNEQVGAVDSFRRAVFTADRDDFATPPDRGDYFVLSGETDRWVVIDVRDDKSGGYELRCDGTLERT